MSQEINVISKSTIKVGPQAESTAWINLTPWDLELLFLEYSQKGLLFLKPDPEKEPASTSLIHHLEISLRRTLDIFPPLAGRLMATSDDNTTTCFSISCNDSGGGPLFIHATTDLSVSDILNSFYVPQIVPTKFFPLAGVRNHDGVSQPLLAVQVTELADGFFIGCSINHLLVDGTSFWNFFNSWAEISRAELIPITTNPLCKHPILNRDKLTLELTGSSSINIDNEHLTNIDNSDKSSPGPLLRDKVFRVSKQSVTTLKFKANDEMMEISKGKISSLQAVIAHIWRSIIRCRFNNNPNSVQKTTFEIPMGARMRLNPPLPDEYFGNAVFPGIVALEAEKILENGLGWTAWQVNRMVDNSKGSEKVTDFYTNWIKKPEFLQFDGLPSNYFILINSPRFNVFGNDFGWGKPVAARSGGANSFDGRITISGGTEEGSMDIELCLFPETLSSLAEDHEFMEFVA